MSQLQQRPRGKVRVDEGATVEGLADPASGSAKPIRIVVIRDGRMVRPAETPPHSPTEKTAAG